MMPILQTKLLPPPARSRNIRRERLTTSLNDGLNRKLTVVSAPAGFGKTTLISFWSQETGFHVAWLSLDSADADLTRFLTYLVSSIQRIAPDVGQHSLRLLQFTPVAQAETVVTTLISDLHAFGEEVIVVLDDYHLVNNSTINDAVAFLIDYLPPSVRVVITTREDPQLPLSRLRSRGEMTELRAADLRFTADEAAIFLCEVMGLDLSSADVAALETRTEGWIAGLQLAALSMEGKDDLSGFISAFAGNDRFIVDYLVEEVLRGQPESVRQFLLQSSMLERVSGSLCDSVMDRDDSAALLNNLERKNLFLLPLDSTREWYRYHQLFLDVLRAYAAADQSDDSARRHRRASEWFETHSMPDEAIRHALAGEDFERAAGLVELAALSMLGSSDEDKLWGWMQAIPGSLMARMPVLTTYFGFASFSREGLNAAESRFLQAENWLNGASDLSTDEMIVANHAALRSLRGTIAVGRAYGAGACGDVHGIVTYARKALEEIPESDDLWSGAASAVLGIGLWTTGELETAYQSFEKGKSRLERAGYMQFQIVSVHILVDIRIAQGRLREAEQMYRQSLALSTAQDETLWGTVDILVGLSELSLEQNKLDEALQYLHRSKELGDHAGLMDTRHRWYIAMAGIMQAQGDYYGALTMLDEASRLYVPGADPDLRPIAALKVHLWLAQARLAEAVSWANSQELVVDEDQRYLREFVHMTVARVRIAQARNTPAPRAIEDTLALLGLMTQTAEQGERAGSMINLLILQALAFEANGDAGAALASIDRALTLAEPEGYVRTFICHGDPMERLLAEAQRRSSNQVFAGRLHRMMTVKDPVSSNASPAVSYLLTARELEVLRLVASGHSNAEIGDQLFLALDTVKGHNRRIYAKLNASRRTEAIARARQLGLLET